MKLNRTKYFSQAQLDEMKSHYENIDPETLKAAKEQFQRLLNHLRSEKEKGTLPTNKKVQQLAQKWSELVYPFVRGDEKLMQQVETFHVENPNNDLQFGIDVDLYRYIKKH